MLNFSLARKSQAGFLVGLLLFFSTGLDEGYGGIVV